MKLNCLRAELNAVLANVTRAAAAKSTLPVLDGILLEAQGSSLTLCCFNLDFGIKKTISAKIEEPGSVVVPMKFFDMTRKFAGEYVELFCSKRFEIKISSGTAGYDILGMSPNDFPELPQVEVISEFEIEQRKFRSMISQTSYAINLANARPVYTGALFELGEGKIRVVTMDDFRVAARNELIDSTDSSYFIVPAKTINELNKIVEDSEEPLRVRSGKNVISFLANGYAVISRLLTGRFMDYTSGFTRPENYNITVKTSDMLSAVERISLVTSEAHKSPIACYFKEGKIEMSCVTPIGSARDVCDFKSAEDIETEIGLNGRLLVDALRAVDTDECRLVFGQPNEPFRLYPPNGKSFMFLLMPVKLRATM